MAAVRPSAIGLRDATVALETTWMVCSEKAPP